MLKLAAQNVATSTNTMKLLEEIPKVCRSINTKM